MSRVRNLELSSTWSWAQHDPKVESVLDQVDGWKPAQAYPSEIHVELLKSGEIPDPYIAFNEHKVQWIGEVEWLYKCTFDFAADSKETHALLEFLGLDTLCDVYLNGEKILVADNMFQTHIVSVELSSLKSKNTLLLHFKSAQLYAKELEAQMGVVRAGSTNLGDPSRVYVRKAQYDWRWDWGPKLMTCGPYRPITLKTYTTRLAEVHPQALLSDSDVPSLKVDVTLAGTLPPDTSLRIRISLSSSSSDDDDNNNILKSQTVPAPPLNAHTPLISWDLAGIVQPWWPVNYGPQLLYTLSVSLLDARGEELDRSTTRVGFRRVKLVQEELEEADEYGGGRTFLVEVNGVRMFMGGSNWIPADNFLTTITPGRYRAWLTLLRDGNQNMVRVWGGGVYEADVFYDICDELGILIWQDFQFACGVYPAHLPSFLASVRKEAEDNVKRLRHHAALAVFCGNNEDYQMVLQWGDVKDFPAIKIYEEVLPSVVATLTSPQPIPYHRGSPYGGIGWDTADPTIGDVHQWNVWGGAERAWHDYATLGGRFVSEFGVPAWPDLRTVGYWVAGEGDGDGVKEGEEGEGEGGWWAGSAVMAQHCRAGSFERRFAILMGEGFRGTEDLATYVYNTQLLQSEAVSYAYQVWRRKWAGRGKEYTSGVLVWQLNDCWPVTSWAIADYFLRPKPAYYTIARQLATFSVGIMRTVIKDIKNDRPPQYYEFGNFQSRGATLEIWGTNATLTARPALLEIHCVDLKSPWTHIETHAVTLLPNQATELLKIPCPGPPREVAAPLPTGDALFTTTYSVVVGARLLDVQNGGEVLARYADWPQPFRFLSPKLLRLAEPGLVLSVVSVDEAPGEARVSVSVERPVKGLVLSAVAGTGTGAGAGEEGEVKWSDNALDLMPGDPQVVVAKGLGGRKVAVAFSGCEKARAWQ